MHTCVTHIVVLCVVRVHTKLHLPDRLAQSGASLTANQGVVGSSPGTATFFLCDLIMKNIYTTILTLSLIQEGQLSVTGERMST